MRFILLYFTHFISFGAFVPFLPLYLRRVLHLSQMEIGWVLAISNLVSLVGLFVWGPFVDRTDKRRRVLAMGMISGGVLYPAYMLTRGLPEVIGLTIVLGAFMTPVIPLLDDMLLTHIRRNGGEYGRTRLWASAAFIVGSTLVGWLLGRGYEGGQFYVFIGAEIAALIVLATFSGEEINRPSATVKDRHFWRSLTGPFIIFLVAAFLGRVAAIGHYNLYSLYLDSIGVSDTVKGIAWSLGVGAEITMMLFTGVIIRRYGAHVLFTAGLLGSAARFALFALWMTPTGALVGQVFHAFTFAAYHVGAVTLVTELAPPGRSATGQFALASLAYGLGAMVGSVLSGEIAQLWGYQMMYTVSTGIALAGAVVAQACSPARRKTNQIA
jgi:PPP family 3-phenylpropionic acid transporter